MYTIKDNPEDFVVKELPKYKLDEDGSFLIFKLSKKDYNTVSAIKLIACFLNIKDRMIGFAGNKDRRAVTEQFISIKGASVEKVLSFKHDLISLEYIGRSNRGIALGGLVGNHFEIVLRDCDSVPKVRDNFVNYFGEQRFSECNADIGKFLLKKDFKAACELILSSGLRNSDIEEYMEDHPNDYVGAIGLLPSKLISLFINAYQSYLWNICVSRIINDKGSDCEIDISGQQLGVANYFDAGELNIIGFESELDENQYEDYMEAVMKEEGVTQRDFIIRQLSHLSAPGGFRDIFSKCSNVSVEDLGESVYKVCFDLSKGSYATVLIRQMFC